MIDGPAVDDVVDERTGGLHHRSEEVEEADEGIPCGDGVVGGSVLCEEEVDAERLDRGQGSRGEQEEEGTCEVERSTVENRRSQRSSIKGKFGEDATCRT